MLPFLVILLIKFNYVFADSCLESIAKSQSQCMAELKQRFHDNGFDSLEETTGQKFHDAECCHYAQFVRCVENKVQKDCGHLVSSTLKTIEKAYIDLANNCSDYTIEVCT